MISTPISWSTHSRGIHVSSWHADTATPHQSRLLQPPTIDINKFNKAGETPLLAAVRSRSMNIMQQLCSATEINVNIADKRGTSPLRASVELGSAEAFDMLFAHKSLDHSATREGDTTLLHAAAACSEFACSRCC